MGKKYSYDIFNNTYHLFYQNGYKWYLLIDGAFVEMYFSQVSSQYKFIVTNWVSVDFKDTPYNAIVVYINNT